MSILMDGDRSSDRLGNPKSGIDYELEELADNLLAQSRRDDPKGDEGYEFLSAGQLDRRRSREIYNQNGIPEPHLFSGLYRRADNPALRERSRRGKAEED